MNELRSTMFAELEIKNAKQILASRSLGFSQIRLLPKNTGVRPIMNLRRRMPSKTKQGLLESSINSLLQPVYSMLSLERVGR